MKRVIWKTTGCIECYQQLLHTCVEYTNKRTETCEAHESCLDRKLVAVAVVVVVVVVVVIVVVSSYLIIKDE